MWGSECSLMWSFRPFLQVEFSYPSHVSEGARDLINRLLKHNPMHRLPIQGVLTHHWVVENSTKKPTTFTRATKESPWACCVAPTQTMDLRCWDGSCSWAWLTFPSCARDFLLLSSFPPSFLPVNIYLFRIMKMYLFLLETINLFLNVACNKGGSWSS